MGNAAFSRLSPLFADRIVFHDGLATIWHPARIGDFSLFSTMGSGKHITLNSYFACIPSATAGSSFYVDLIRLSYVNMDGCITRRASYHDGRSAFDLNPPGRSVGVDVGRRDIGDDPDIHPVAHHPQLLCGRTDHGRGQVKAEG